jgi:hypothetical protein
LWLLRLLLLKVLLLLLGQQVLDGLSQLGQLMSLHLTEACL